MTNVSVCMAAYDGSAYILEQISSILDQLAPDDELIIVDDASNDTTRELIATVADARIRLLYNVTNQGISRTFERALREARGKYIFLSDQDDVWLSGRVALMMGTLEQANVDLVVSNFCLIDGAGRALPNGTRPRLKAVDSTSRWGNIGRIMLGRANYFGCAMAFRASFRDLLLPFSANSVGHCLWIAIVANVRGRIRHIEADTLAHRMHDKNATVVGRPLHLKLRARLDFVHLFLRAKRLSRRDF